MNIIEKIKKTYKVAEKLSDVQFIFWYSFNDEDEDYILETEDTNILLSEWYNQEDNNILYEAIDGISKHELINPHKILWEQIIIAFNQELYDLTLSALFIIADGILSKLSDNINDTSYINKSVEIPNMESIISLDDMSEYLISKFGKNGKNEIDDLFNNIVLQNKKEYFTCDDFINYTRDDKIVEIWNFKFGNHSIAKDKMKRAEALAFDLGNSKESRNIDYKFDLSFLHYTYVRVIKDFYQSTSFSNVEPIPPNRHWILHGRSGHIANKMDCIKVLNFLYSITLLHDFNKSIECVD